MTESNDMDGGSIALKIGVEAIKRTAPKGIVWVRSYLTGKTLLIVGPSASGKTTFSNYLVFGILNPESMHVSTERADPSPMFSVNIGRNDILKLRVKKSIDLPGQSGPEEHANLVLGNRPHALLIMLDATSSHSSIKDWLSKFSERLENLFIEDKRLKNKVKSIVICLNKRDKISEKQYNDLAKSIKVSLKVSLKNVLGNERVNKIKILPCVSIADKKFDRSLLDSVISNLAMQLKK